MKLTTKLTIVAALLVGAFAFVDYRQKESQRLRDLQARQAELDSVTTLSRDAEDRWWTALSASWGAKVRIQDGRLQIPDEQFGGYRWVSLSSVTVVCDSISVALERTGEESIGITLFGGFEANRTPFPDIGAGLRSPAGRDLLRRTCVEMVRWIGNPMELLPSHR